MEEGSVRLLVAGPRSRDSKIGIFVTLIILLPLLAPIGVASAELQVNVEDFGILSQLDDVLDNRIEMVGNSAVSSAADSALEQLRLEERVADGGDPLGRVNENLDNLQISDTTPPDVIHPTPYTMVLNPEQHPPEWANN
ncbi:MAG TPA: hypothetical protein QF621_07080, partial [Candidatus Thalassarchaeaceae archaeon]|nr:hypothetical protein [Candidatus Thalassarchaeaceae archaeon]